MTEMRTGHGKAERLASGHPVHRRQGEIQSLSHSYFIVLLKEKMTGCGTERGKQACGGKRLSSALVGGAGCGLKIQEEPPRTAQPCCPTSLPQPEKSQVQVTGLIPFPPPPPPEEGGWFQAPRPAESNTRGGMGLSLLRLFQTFPYQDFFWKDLSNQLLHRCPA